MNGKSQLKIERERRGWSQHTVAEAVGTDPSTVSRWERGISFPYPFFREKLCMLFEKNAYELGIVQHVSDNDDQSSVIQGFVRDPSIPELSPGTEGLIGRENLLHQIQQRLFMDGGGASVALHGLPGVGKTTLALQIAHDKRVLVHFRDGILWAGLGTESNVLGHLSRWGRLLGVASPTVAKQGTIDGWAMALRSCIGTRRMLLILDDFWKAEEALALMIGGPYCAYIITTRFPQIPHYVVIDSENIFSVHELSEQESLALLTRCTPNLVNKELQQAQNVVRLVGGLPLALTLIGKYLRLQTYTDQPHQVKAAFEQVCDVHARLHITEVLPSLERHPSLPQNARLSLEAVIAVSDQQLDEEAQGALRALSVFPAKPNTFSEEMALAVCALPVEVLDTLSDAGLVESIGPDRYTMHQTIADYAHAHMQDSSATQRLVECIVTFVPHFKKNYDVLEQESPVILAALDYAFEQGMNRELIEIVLAFAPFLLIRGLYNIAHVHLQRTHQVALTIGDRVGLITALEYLGNIAERRGNYTQAEAYYKEGLLSAHQIEQQECIIQLLINLGAIALRQGNYAQSEKYTQEGLVLAYQVKKQEQIVQLLTNTGMLAELRGDCMQAESYYQEGLTLARRIDGQEQIILLLINLGVLAEEHKGNYSQAESYYQEGLMLARQIEHREHIGLLLGNLGSITGRQGKRVQADAFYREGLKQVQEIGNPGLFSLILSDRAEMYIRQHRLKEAEADAYAVFINSPQGSQELYAYAWYGLARIACMQSNIVEAHQKAMKSLSIFETITGHRMIEEVKHWLTELPK